MATTRIRGTSALQMAPMPQRTQWESEQERRERLRQERILRQRRQRMLEKKREMARARARKAFRKKVLVVAYIASIFAILSTVVVGYARIADLQMQNNAIQAEVTANQTQVADLKLQLSQKTDLQVIRQQAQERLGMDYPKAYQVLGITPTQQSASASAQQEQDPSAASGQSPSLSEVLHLLD